MKTINHDIERKLDESQKIDAFKRSGDQSVLLSLYQPYMDLVFGVCLQYLKNRDDAQDAVINIYEELIEKVKKYEIEYFRAWLYQLAKNHCLMILRKKKVYFQEFQDAFMDFSSDEHLSAAFSKETQLNMLEHCIEQLNGYQKQSIELFYLQSKCYFEIAASTQQDIGKVKSHIQNGRRNLKICMEKNTNH